MDTSLGMANDPVVTLTATARQARLLRDHWAEAQLQSGQQVWETPQIFSIESWIRRLWDQALQQGDELPLLLTVEQERNLWQQTLPQPLEGEWLRSTALSLQAMRANHLLHHWMDPEQPLPILGDPQEREEWMLFLNWHQRFHQQCHEQGWLEPAGLTAVVEEQLLGGRLVLPQRLYHYGRSCWSGCHQRLLQRLQQHGVEVEEYLLPTITARVEGVVTADPQQQIEGAVAAIAQQLQERPQSRIGMVVPQLGRDREAIEEALTAVLVPQGAVTALSPNQLPFRFSRGPALLEDPRIHHAILLIRLVLQQLTLSEVLALLHSPWLLPGVEEEPRARLVPWIRNRGGSGEVKLVQLMAWLEELSEGIPVRLFGALRALDRSSLITPAPPWEWAQRFTSILAHFEWSSNGSRSAWGHAAYDSWREGLDRFAALDRVIPSLTVDEALSQLQTILAGIEVVPVRGDTRVEVMTPDEAEGVTFDLLWVLDCDHHNWPRFDPPSPMLPLRWQRSVLPGVDPGVARQRAQQRLIGFSRQAARVVYSFSRSGEVGGDPDRELTPLLPGVVPTLLENLPPALRWWNGQERALEMEEIVDRVPPLPPGVRFSGGSRLLTDQSQCPFRAFVHHRLGAEKLESEWIGIDSREHGSLLHALLQRCWEALERRSERLQPLSDRALEQQVVHHAERLLQPYQQRQSHRLGPRMAALEANRITALALQMLQLDRLRPPFVVIDMESLQQVEVGGVQLRVKMDRVDQIEEGIVLIDYKSGQVSPSSWHGERPNEPQLPLYTRLLQSVVAVLFAQIGVREVRYKGVGEREVIAQISPPGRGKSPLEGVDEWSQQLQHWSDVVDRLGEEFRAGVVTVTPQQGRSCTYCGLESICRVELKK